MYIWLLLAGRGVLLNAADGTVRLRMVAILARGQEINVALLWRDVCSGGGVVLAEMAM